MSIKYANSSGGVGDPTRPGVIVRIVEGEPWDSDDPFVKARPELFDDTPKVVRSTRAKKALRAPVETATAAPDEVRNTGRRRKSS